MNEVDIKKYREAIEAHGVKVVGVNTRYRYSNRAGRTFTRCRPNIEVRSNVVLAKGLNPLELAKATAIRNTNAERSRNWRKTSQPDPYGLNVTSYLPN